MFNLPIQELLQYFIKKFHQPDYEVIWSEDKKILP